MKGVNAFKKSNGKKSNESNEIPTDAIEALPRTLYPAMVAYFESEEGQREFAEWQAEQSGANLHTGEVKPSKKSGQIA